MKLQTVICLKHFRTERTLIWSFATVFTSVSPQVARILVTFVAQRTLVRLVSRMDSHVCAQSSRLSKCPVTHPTFVRFVSAVNSAVHNKFTWRRELFSTDSAFKRFLSRVTSPMYFQCSAVVATFATLWALVLICMNIHMGTEGPLRWHMVPTQATGIQLFSSVSFSVSCQSFSWCRGCTQILLCWMKPTFFITEAPCTSRTQTNRQWDVWVACRLALEI